MINKKQFKNLLSGRSPKIAIILGSGLSEIANAIENPLIIDYHHIEGFPKSTVKGHKSRMVIGNFSNKEVLCMQGRFHLYEGHHPGVIADVIRSLRYVGIEELIITNAAGSLNPDIHPGEIMMIKDHINFSGQNSLIAFSDQEEFQRFVDMSNAYDKDLRAELRDIASEMGVLLHEGVYLMVLGPNFDTAAEVKAFRIMGADAVGMSTVPEVLAAVDCGIKGLAFSSITNFGTGMQEHPLTHDETLSVSSQASKNLTRLIQAYLAKD